MPKRKNKAFSADFLLRNRFFRRSLGRVTPPPAWDRLPKLLTLRLTAEVLQVHRNTLRLWDKQGKLPAVRIGTRQDRRFDREQVRQLWYTTRLQTQPAIPQPWRMVRDRLRTVHHRWLRPVAATGTIAALFIVFGSLSLVHADQPTTKRTFAFTTCNGWSGSLQATKIDLNAASNPRDFTAENSAVFSSTLYRVNSGSGVRIGALDAPSGTITCTGLRGQALPDNSSIDSLAATLSFTSTAPKNSLSSFIMETSSDGETWTAIKTLPAAADAPNLVTALIPGAWTLDMVSKIQVRVRAEIDSPAEDLTAKLDGLTLDVGYSSGTTATRPHNRQAQQELDRLTAFSKSEYEAGEQPSVTIPKSRPRRFLFIDRGTEYWAIQSITVRDRNNTTAKAKVRTYDVGSKGAIDTRVVLDMRGLHPGKYAVVVSMLTPNGSVEEIEESFTWGVVALNFSTAVPAVGQQQRVSMGVLDDLGHTICDARLKLDVVNPKGKKVTYSTQRKSIKTNPECVDKGFTDIPDYLATFDVDQPGLYRLRLVADTAFGQRVLEDSFVAERGPLFVVERVQYPARIYPPKAYPVRIAVTPARDYFGLVRERLPNDFEVTEITPFGGTVTSPDDPNEQFIEWFVDWKKGQTYFLTYAFDAPDISPALFLAGPLSIGDTFLDGALFKEPRQWQIASDAVGTAVENTRLYSTGFELQSTDADEEYTANINTPVIDTATFRSGAASMETLLGAASTEGARMQYKSANTQDDYYVRAYINITTAPAAETKILCFNDSTPSDQVCIRMNTDRTLELWDEEDGPTQITGTSSALATGTWYRIELRYDTTTLATTIVDARLDGVSFSSASNLNHANGPRDISWGILTSTTGEFNWDDIGLNDDSGGAPQNWPDSGKIVHLKPNALVTNTCTSGDASASLNETNPDDATTNILCDVNGDLYEAGVTDSATVGIGANDLIRLVQGNVNFNSISGTGTSTNTISLNVPTNNEVSATLTVNTEGTYFVNSDALPRTPRITAYDVTAATLTETITAADIDATEIRFTTPDASPDVNLSTLWVLVEYVPAEGGRLYSSGFELQSNTAGVEWGAVAGTTSIDTTTFRSGLAALRTNGMGSGTAEYVEQDFKAANSDGPFFLRTYLNVATLPTAENRIIGLFDSGGTARAYMTITDSGGLAQLKLYDEDGLVGTHATVALSAWHRVEIKFDSSGAGATDTIESKINGADTITSSTRNLTNGVTRFRLGANLNAEAQTTGDWYFDDVALNQNAGSTQNSYPGAGSIVHMQPDSTGDNSAWTGTNADVDEITPDDGTTLISSTTLNDIEDVNLESAASAGVDAADTVTLVSMGLRYNNVGTTAINFNTRLKDATGAGAIRGEEQRPADTTWRTHRLATPRLPTITAYDRPHVTTAWTPTDLDNTQLGVRLTVDSTGTAQVSTLWLLVEFTSPTTMTVSGTVRGTNESSAIGNPPCDDSTQVVRIRVNGTTDNQTTSCSSTDGTYSKTVNKPSAGQAVTVYLDNVTANASAVVRWSSGNVSVDLIQDRVVVSSTDTTAITNSVMDAWDSDNETDGIDGDLGFTVTSGALTVSNTRELHVVTAKTFTPGGTVTTNAGGAQSGAGGDVHIVGTLTMGTNGLSVGGDYNNAGTFNKSATQVTTFAATATGFTIAPGTGNFANVTFNGVSGDWTPSAALNIDEALTMTAGTLLGTQNVTVLTDVTGTAGVINLTGGTLEQRVGGTELFGPTTSNTDWVFNSLTFSRSAGTAVIDTNLCSTCDVTVVGVLALSKASDGAGTTLQAGDKTWHLTNPNEANPFDNDGQGADAGALQRESSTFAYEGDNNSGDVTIENATYNNLTLTSDGVAENYDGANTFGVAATFTINSNATLVGTDNFNIVTLVVNGAVNMTGGTLTATNNADISGAGSITLYAVSATGANDIQFSAPATISNNASTDGNIGSQLTFNANVTITGTLTNTTNGVITTDAGTPTVTVNNTGSICGGNAGNCTFYNLTFGGASMTIGTNGFKVLNNLTLPASVTAGTNTVTMTAGDGTGQLVGAGATLYNLTIGEGGDGGGKVVTLVTSDVTISNTLNVITADTFDITGRTATLSCAACSALTLSGTIDGATGRLIYTTSTNFPTSGTINSILRIDGSSGDRTVPERTYGGEVELYSNNSLTRTFTFATVAAQTINFSSNLELFEDSTGAVVVAGNTNNPIVNITGNLLLTTTGTSDARITSGSQLWTVGGDLDIDDCFSNCLSAFTSLTLNGSSKTIQLTSSETFTTVTIDGTYNVSVAPGPIGMSVSGTLTVNTGKSLTISASQFVTSDATGTVTLTGTGAITGAGTLQVENSNLGTAGTLSSIVQFDTEYGSLTIPARTYGGLVTVYNESVTTNRTATLGSGTHNYSNDLNLVADRVTDLFLDGGTNNPTVNLTGNLDFTGTGEGTEVLAMGDGTWTVTGNVDFTAGVVGPQIANLTPTWDDSALYRRELTSSGACVLTETYSCTGTTTDSVGLTTNGAVCDNPGPNEIHDDERIGLEYDPTGINDSAVIKQVQFNPYVASAISGQNVDFGHATVDDLSAETCTSSTGTWSRLGASDYLSNSNAFGSTGTKIIDLGATAVAHVQARVTGTTPLGLAINGIAENASGTINDSSASSNAPMLRVAYVVNTTGTLVMNGTTKTLTPAGNFLNNLTVSGGSVTGSGALTIKGNYLLSGGSFTAPSSMTVEGNWTNSGGTLVEGTGTVTLAGATSTTLNSNCVATDTCTNENFYNLTINKTDAADGNDNVTLTTNGIRLTNTLTITDGELVQGALNVRAEGSTAVTIAAAGKWSNVSTGDIKLGGSAANAGVWYLDKDGNSDGCGAGDTDDITLTTTDTGQAARALSGAGTFTWYDVTVSYMNATVAITVNGGTNAGNNTGSFTFQGCGIDIQGICKANDQTTNCADLGTIRVAVGGTLKSETDVNGGNGGTWTISSVPGVTSGSIVTVFVDGAASAADRAVGVTKYDGSGNILNMVLYKEHLALGSDDTGVTLTSPNLGSYDNSVSGGDADVFHEYSTDFTNTNCTTNTGGTTDCVQVDYTGLLTQEELFIKGGTTYRPDSAGSDDYVYTHDVEIDGTLNLDANTLRFDGGWTTGGSATFTSGTSSVIATATTGTETIDTVAAAAQPFNVLTFGESSGTATWNLLSALDVNGALSITRGTLGMNGSNTINTAGDVTISANGLYTKGSGAWTFDGTGTNTWTDSTSGQDLGLVTIDGTTKIINLASSVKAEKVTVTDTLDLAGSGYTLMLTGSGQAGSKPLTVTGTLDTDSSSTVDYSGTATTDITRVAYYNLGVKPGADGISHHAEGGGTLALGGSLTVGNGSNTGTFNLDTNDPTVTVAGAVTIAASGTLVASGTNGLSAAGNWSNSGTFTATTGSTVTLNGSAAQTLTHNGNAFYNLTLNNTGADGATDDVTPSAGTLDVNNDFNITNGDLKLNTNDPNVTVAHNVAVGASAFVTKADNGSATWTFDGTTAATFTDSTGTPQDIGLAILDKTDAVAPGTNDKLTLASSMTVTKLTIDGTVNQNDTLDLANSGYTLRINGNAADSTVLTVNGTLAPGTNSTVQYAATATGNVNVTTTTYNNLDIAPGATETYVLTGNLTGANKLTGNLTNGANATLDVVTVSNYGIQLDGSWTNNGAFTAQNGVVTFSATSSGKTITGNITGSSKFYDLTFNGSSGGWSNSAGAIEVGNDLTMTAGTLSGTNSVTVNGGVTGTAGIINKTGGVLEQRIAAGKNFGPTTASTNWTFYDLQFSNSAGTTQTVTTQSCSTCGVTVSDALTIGRGTDTAGTVLSAGDKTWTLSGAIATPLVLTASPAATFTASTSTVSYTGVNGGGNVNIAITTYSGLGCSPGSAEVYDLADNVTASGTVTVGANCTLTIASTKTLTHTGATLTLSGVINGAGTLEYQSATAFPSTGTISSILRMNAMNNAQSLDCTGGGRTFGGAVEFYNGHASTARIITLCNAISQIANFSSNVTVNGAGGGAVTLEVNTNDPTVNITGNLTTGTSGGGAETVSMGGGTWTVSGNVSLANSTISNTTGGTLKMDGTASKTLIGNAQSLYNLNIDPSNAGDTIVAQTSNLTVTNNITVAANDTLNISSVTLSLSNPGTLTLNGTLSGATLYYNSTSTFPAGGTMNANMWLNGSAGTQTLPGRTYGGAVQIQCFCAHTVVFGAGPGETLTFSSTLSIAENSNGVNMTIDAATNDPTVNVTSTFDINGNAGTTGQEVLNAGAGTWTFGGQVDLYEAGGAQAAQYNYETTPTANKVKMIATGGNRTIETAGNALYDFEVAASSNTVTLEGPLTANNDLTITTGTLDANTTENNGLVVSGNFSNSGTFTARSGSVTMSGTSKSIGGSSVTSFYTLVVNGTITYNNISGTALNTSDGNITNQLTVNAGKTLTLAADAVVRPTHATNEISWGDGTSTITGSGRLQFLNGTAGPGTGGVVSSVTNYYSSTGVVAASTFDDRTYSASVELYNDTSTTQTFTCDAGAYNISGGSSDFLLRADGTGSVQLVCTSGTSVSVGRDFDYVGGGGGSEQVTASGAIVWTIGRHIVLTGGTFTASTGNEVLLTGTGNLTGSGNTFYKVTVNGNGQIVTADNLFVDNTLTIGGAGDLDNDTLTLNSDLIITQNGTVTIHGSGTDLINGAGRLVMRSSNLSVNGTVSVNVAFNATTGDITVPNRNYGGNVELDDTSAAGGKTLTLGSNSNPISITGNLTMYCAPCETVLPAPTFTADTSDPNITVGSNVDFDDQWGSFGTFSLGSGTWTVGGHFDLTSLATLNHNSGTLLMNGTGTLTSNSKTLNNLTIDTAGLVTLASASHTLAGNLTIVGSNDVDPLSSTVVMNGTGGKTIDAGGETLNNLTIDPVSAATITLQGAADLTVSGNLTVASSDTLAISTSRVITLTANTGTSLTLNGTISGSAGWVYYRNSVTTFPTTGTITAVVRLDAVNGDMTVPNRNGANSFGGQLQLYNASGVSRTFTLGSGAGQTIDIGGNLDLQSTAVASTVVVAGNTNNPNVNVTGNFTASNASGTYTVSAGSGVWTVTSNFDLSNVGTFNHNSGRLVMNGTSAALTTNGKTLFDLYITNTSGTVTLPNATVTLAGDFKMSGAGATATGGASSIVNMTGASKVLEGGARTILGLTISAATTAQTSNLTVSGGLTIAASTTFTITTVVVTNSGTSEVTWGDGSSTVAGSGVLSFTDVAGGPGTGGVISATARFDATNGNLPATTFDARTYNGPVAPYSDSSTANRTVTMAAGTYTLTGTGANFTPIANNARDVIVDASANNPTVTIGGNLDFTGTGSGFEVVSAGTGTWTVSGDVNLTNGLYGPTIARIGPSFADTTRQEVQILTDLACGQTTLYSCLGSGTLQYGNFNNGGDCINLNTDLISDTDRAYMQYSLAGITDTVSILGAQVGVDVTATYAAAVNVARSTTDDINSVSCTVSSGRFPKLNNATYGSVDLSVLGNKVIPLGATGGVDIKTRLTTTDILTVGLQQGSTEAAPGSVSGSVANGYPALYVSYLVSGTPTLTMNGAGKTLTAAGNALYNVNLTSTITLANETLLVAGDLNLTGADVTPGSSTVSMTGVGKTLTAPVAGDTLSSLTIDPATAGTITLAAGGGDLSLASLLTMSSGDTLSLGAGRTLTLSATTGTSLTFSGTIAGSGKLVYMNATSFPSSGTLTAPLRMDATNAASQQFGNRTFGGAVEIYNSGGTSKTVSNNNAGALTFSSTLDLLRADTATVTLDLNTTDPSTTTVTGNLTIGAGTTLSAPSTNAFNLAGNYSNAGTLMENGGTVTLNGTTSTTLDSGCTNTDSCASQNFNNLIINKTDAADANDNVTLTTNGINVAATLTITDGELVQGALNVRAEGATAVSVGAAGKWSNISTGDIKLGGSMSNAGTVYWDKDGNNNGCDVGDTDDITFTTTDGVTVRNISGAGVFTLYDLTISFMNATVAITANGSTDAGGNTGSWTISACFSVTGSCTQYDQATACVDDGSNEIRVAVNGTLDPNDKDTTVDGSWSIPLSPTPSSGDVITVFINTQADANEAVAVTKFDGTGNSISGMLLYQRHLTIGSADNQTITNANLALYDNSVSADEDVFYEVTAGNDLTVDYEPTGTGQYTDEELYVVDGNTYQPASAGGADVTVTNVEIADTGTAGVGTWTADSNAINVAGNWTVNGSAVFTAGTSTLTMNGTGTLTSGSSALNNFTTSGGGTITLANATHTIAGNLNIGSTGLTAGTSTVTMTGTGKTIDGGGKTLNNLTISGTETLQNTDLTVGAVLQVDTSKSLTINPSRRLTMTSNTGTPLVLNGTIDGTGTLEYRKADATTPSFPTGGTFSAHVEFATTNGTAGARSIIPNRTFGGNVACIDAVGTLNLCRFYTGTIDISGNLSVTDNGSGTTLDGATNNPAINLTGNFSTVNGAGVTLNMGSGIWTVSGNFDLSNVTNFNNNSGTLKMNGSSKSLTSNGNSINNFEVSGGSITQVGALTVAGTFVESAGAFTQAANNNLLVTGSAFTLANSTTFTKASGTGILILDGNPLDFTDSNATKQDLGNVRIGQSPATTNLKSDKSVTSLTIPTTDTYNTRGWDVDISGAFDCQGTCTLDMSDTAGANYEGDGSIITVGANYTMSSSGTFTNEATGGRESKIYMKSTTGSDANRTITTGGKAFRILEVDNAGITNDDMTVTGNLTVDGALTVTDGQFDLNTNDPTTDLNGSVTIATNGDFVASGTATTTMAGNYTNNGAFTDNSGGVTFDGAAQQTLSGQMTGTGDDFNNLTITNASGSDPQTSPSVIIAAGLTTAGTFTAATNNVKIRFNAGSTYTLNAINFSGSSGNMVYLRSSAADSLFYVNAGAGSRTVTYTNVKDSDACGSTGGEIDASDGTNLSGGNTFCWFINKLTVLISGDPVSLGTLTTANVSYDGITSAVSTNAAAGYISLVKYNNTLTSGANTIDDTTGGTIAANTEEYGVSSSDADVSAIIATTNTSPACSTTTQTQVGAANATALTTAFKQFAGSTGAGSETTTLCFLAGISGATVPGTYTSTVTIVTTSRF